MSPSCLPYSITRAGHLILPSPIRQLPPILDTLIGRVTNDLDERRDSKPPGLPPAARRCPTGARREPIHPRALLGSGVAPEADGDGRCAGFGVVAGGRQATIGDVENRVEAEITVKRRRTAPGAAAVTRTAFQVTTAGNGANWSTRRDLGSARRWHLCDGDQSAHAQPAPTRG